MKTIFCLILFVCLGHMESEASLPLMIWKATNDKLPLVLYLSGDGGYNTFSKNLIAGMRSDGYGIMALDSKKYFWKTKSPKELANDMIIVLTDYLKENPQKQVVIIGYSFGASVLPFMLNLFPAGLQKKVHRAIGISPGRYADFEVTWATLLNQSPGNKAYPVIEESLKQKNIPLSFIFGQQEDEATTGLFKDAGFSVFTLPGSHDYERNYNLLGERLRSLMK